MTRKYLLLLLSATIAAGRAVLACSSDDSATSSSETDASADPGHADGSSSMIPPLTDAGTHVDADADAAPVTCSKDGWCYQPLPEAGSPLSITSIWAAPDHRAWAVTSDGHLLAWDATSWTEIANLGSSLHSITGTSASDLWIAGDGIIAHGTIAAGKLALAMVPVDPYSGYQTIVAGTNVWVLGSDGNVYRLDPLAADSGVDAGTAAPLKLTPMVITSDYPGDYSNFRVTALWGSSSEIWVAGSDQTYCDIVSCASLSEVVFRKWLGGNNADSSWSRVRLSTNEDGGVLPMYSNVTTGVTTTDHVQVAVVANSASQVVRVATNATFTVEPLMNYVGAQGVWATTGADIWLAGPGGVRHWDGATWQIGRLSITPGAPLFHDLHTISGSSGDLWTAGDDVALHRVSP